MVLAKVRLGWLGEDRSGISRMKEKGSVGEVKERRGMWKERERRGEGCGKRGRGEGEVEVEDSKESKGGKELHSLGMAVSASLSIL